MITQEKLHKLFHYNKQTGELTRKITTSSRAIQGDVVGCLCQKSGYSSVNIAHSTYHIHRLAFLYVIGRIPALIDHIDGDKNNNKWDNLRECTQAENRYNSRIMSNNTSGVKGISFVQGRSSHYRAGVKGSEGRVRKCFSINLFGSKEKALEAAILWVVAVREDIHGEFTNHG